jgi:hypothetical protein
MSASPIFDPLREALGRERLEQFIEGHAKVQAMTLFLVMSTTTMPRTGYSDEAIDAMKTDADDVRKAADEWASFCETLADQWLQQRRANPESLAYP